MKNMDTKLYRAKPYIPQEDKQYILSEWKNILDTGMFVQGKNVEKLEKLVAEYCNVKHAIATSSGGTALEVALMATGIKNKKFIVCTQTYVASISAIIRSGNIPVIVDMDEKFHGLSSNIINKYIDSDTAGVMLVHMAGYIASDYKEIQKICKQNNLLLIEDAAHAMGASIEGNKAGAISDIGCFSFFPTKIITTGEGGIITTNNDEIAEQARIIRNHGCVRAEAKIPGLDYGVVCTYASNNFRMQELSAVLGISQMQRVDEFVAKRNILAERYYQNLKPLKSLTCPNEYLSKDQIHSWWQYMIVVDKSVDRTNLAESLLQNNIPTANAYWPPCHEQPVLKEYSTNDYPVVDDILNRHLALPIYVEMSLEQVDFVCDTLKHIIFYLYKKISN